MRRRTWPAGATRPRLSWSWTARGRSFTWLPAVPEATGVPAHRWKPSLRQPRPARVTTAAGPRSTAVASHARFVEALPCGRVSRESSSRWNAEPWPRSASRTRWPRATGTGPAGEWSTGRIVHFREASGLSSRFPSVSRLRIADPRQSPGKDHETIRLRSFRSDVRFASVSPGSCAPSRVFEALFFLLCSSSARDCGPGRRHRQ